jgi:hypothetical protein
MLSRYFSAKYRKHSLAQVAKRCLRGTALLERIAGWRMKNTSYAQFGEDMHILGYYKRAAFSHNIHPGKDSCFVDVGCYRPIADSNSYFFHKIGWHCINVDATPGSMNRFKRIRPTDTNLEVAIGEAKGQGTFHVFGTPSVWNTFDDGAARHAQNLLGYAPQRVVVQISPLREILDQHLKGRELEVISMPKVLT